MGTCPAAAPRSSRLASVACSAPMQVSGLATTALSRPASTSRRAPESLPGGEVVKARALSGEDGLLFIRNSVTGAVECVVGNVAELS